MWWDGHKNKYENIMEWIFIIISIYGMEWEFIFMLMGMKWKDMNSNHGVEDFNLF